MKERHDREEVGNQAQLWLEGNAGGKEGEEGERVGCGAGGKKVPWRKNG